MTSPASLWIEGPSRSGKTTRLIEQFRRWVQDLPPASVGSSLATSILVFAANGDNRIELAQRLSAATRGRHAFRSTTPLGFLLDEVTLFWPLLLQKLDLQTQFPLRLRPETEQDLATRLWRPALDEGQLRREGVSEYRMVRRTLDLMQLAAVSCTPLEDVPVLLHQGLLEQEGSEALWECMGQSVLHWRNWCLERGLLTYSLGSELYWRYLLPDETYRAQLARRYRQVLADDVDEYPAIARSLFEAVLASDGEGAFTFNPEGGMRLGLGADPDALATLAERCQVESLGDRPEPCLAESLGSTFVALTENPVAVAELPAEAILAMQTVSRAQLLRRTAEFIIQAVKAGEARPQDIAVIGPGLDAIARYALMNILQKQNVAVESLNDQRPLVSAPMTRALLTLLALVYPDLGRLVDRNSVAEMLVVLSQSLASQPDAEDGAIAGIDPVRAGLLVDYCFEPHPSQPRLLAATTFPRWDRLGYQATQAYEAIRQWINDQHEQQDQRLTPSPVAVLDRAIQRFLWNGSRLPYDQLAALRELLETAQHYWDVEARLQQHTPSREPQSQTVERFIQLLRGGTITANPYPLRTVSGPSNAVTLATIYQYSANRCAHRWQFWLDVGSGHWLTGGAGLFGAPLFLEGWHGQAWTPVDQALWDENRLRRQMLDLLGRSQERVYLCYSDLSASGQEQMGPLLALVNVATEIPTENQNSSPVSA